MYLYLTLMTIQMRVQVLDLLDIKHRDHHSLLE